MDDQERTKFIEDVAHERATSGEVLGELVRSWNEAAGLIRYMRMTPADLNREGRADAERLGLLGEEIHLGAQPGRQAEGLGG